jgi:hypothetical protein
MRGGDAVDVIEGGDGVLVGIYGDQLWILSWVSVLVEVAEMDLRKLFEEIDIDTINRFVNEKRQEDLHLEFKAITKADLSYKPDKKNFARILSGFANSAGGLVVWGVDARPDKQGIDCAQEQKSIQSLSVFLSKLNEFTGQFVSPVVDGVEHKLVPLPSDDDAGFAVTLVPESDSTPYRAEAGVGRYYKRNGSSFYPMEHFDLEDMFGRRRKPKFDLTYRLRFSSSSSQASIVRVVTVHIDFDVVNVGRGIARFPFVGLKIADQSCMDTIWSSPAEYLGIPLSSGERGSEVAHFCGGADAVLHVQVGRALGRVTKKVQTGTMHVDDIMVDWMATAADVRMMHGTLIVPGNEILDLALQHCTL